VNRIVLGAVIALLLAGTGLFWWQGRAATDRGAPPPEAPAGPNGEEPLPFGDAGGLRGAALPEADPVTREQRRFDRIDRNRDGRITANELLAPRAAAFRKLDVDGNNLLTFQEWAVRTLTRFRNADGNRDNALTREEFATTKPKRSAQPACRCSPMPRSAAPARKGAAPPPADIEDSGSDEGDPAL
jgi:hypothetical protein